MHITISGICPRSAKPSGAADFAPVEDLRNKIDSFIDLSDNRVHPSKWTSKSVARTMAYAEPRKEAA